jgi:hypothetical protein
MSSSIYIKILKNGNESFDIRLYDMLNYNIFKDKENRSFNFNKVLKLDQNKFSAILDGPNSN